MPSWSASCSGLVVFLILAVISGQANSAKPSRTPQNNDAAIKNLVGAYNADRNWTRLRTGLEPLLEAGSAARKQLDRIPADEEWPLKKASAVPGYLDLLTVLLDSGLDAELDAGPHAASMLHWASLGGLRDVAELLLARGASLQRRTSGGATPLLLAARNGHSELAGAFLDRGADAGAATWDGWTALHVAATRDDLRLAESLVAAGASTAAMARTRWGSSTPLDVARIYRQPRVEEYLSSLEAGDKSPT